jgi:peptide/nickel transport system permease protein
MLIYIISRLGQAAITVFVMATIVFLAVYTLGDPIAILAPPEADQLTREMMAAKLGLDKPLYEQYGMFIWAALHGDLGRSFVFNEPALGLILSRMPATMELSILALIIATAVGIPLGLYSGLNSNKFGGKAVVAGSILGFSLPNFWQGLMLILIFAVVLGWLPAGGRGETQVILGIPLSIMTVDGLLHLILPAINLALFKVALVIRVARAGTREAMLQDYVRFARAKGLPRHRVIMVHILKNIMIPVVTVIGLELGSMIAFAVITESVFAYPGIGKLLIDSINSLDRPVIVAYLMVVVAMFAIINLIVDLIYALLDPRVRLSGAKA